MRFAFGSHRASGLGELAISDDTDRRLDALIAERRWPVWSAPPMRAGDATFHAGGTRAVEPATPLLFGVRASRPH